MPTAEPRIAAKIAQFEQLIAELKADLETAPRGQRTKFNRRLKSAQFLLAIYRASYIDSRTSA
jgi:hypothetical protein